MTISPTRASPFVGNLIGAGSMVAWAMGFPAAEYLLASWDPVLLAAARFVLATAAVMTLWVLWEGPRAMAAVDWWRGLWISGIGFGGGAYCILVSQSLTDPVTVAIFASASPLTAAIVDAIWDRRRFGWPFLIGLVAAVAGGVIATGGGAPGDFGLGALFAVLSAGVFSWGTLMMNRHLGGSSVLARTALSAAGGGLALTIVCLVLAPFGLVAIPSTLDDPTGWLALTIYAVVALAVSQFLWVAAAARLGLTVAAFHINVAPFYTMIIMLALGGAWSWPQAIGAGVVALGVVLAQR